MVKPEDVKDEGVVLMAREIVKRVEDELSIRDRLRSMSSARCARLITQNKIEFMRLCAIWLQSPHFIRTMRQNLTQEQFIFISQAGIM